MSRERFVLRHMASGRPWANHDGPVVFSSRADALAAALRFVCEPDAFAVAAVDADAFLEVSSPKV